MYNKSWNVLFSNNKLVNKTTGSQDEHQYNQLQMNLKQKLIDRIPSKPFKLSGTTFSPQQTSLTKFTPAASACYQW